MHNSSIMQTSIELVHNRVEAMLNTDNITHDIMLCVVGIIRRNS